MTKTITREQIKNKLNALEPMLIVEALPPKYFDAEHLPGALNIPHDEVRDKAADMLRNKDEFIIVYCASTACTNSKIAAETLQQIGYTNVHEYVEGKQDWLEAKLPVESNN